MRLIFIIFNFVMSSFMLTFFFDVALLAQSFQVVELSLLDRRLIRIREQSLELSLLLLLDLAFPEPGLGVLRLDLVVDVLHLLDQFRVLAQEPHGMGQLIGGVRLIRTGRYLSRHSHDVGPLLHGFPDLFLELLGLALGLFPGHRIRGDHVH